MTAKHDKTPDVHGTALATLSSWRAAGPARSADAERVLDLVSPPGRWLVVDEMRADPSVAAAVVLRLARQDVQGLALDIAVAALDVHVARGQASARVVAAHVRRLVRGR